MTSQDTGARSPDRMGIDGSQFLSIRMSGDPSDALAAVSRALREHRDPGTALAACSPWIDGHGVEAVVLAGGGELLYVNKGDTYDATLCHLAGRGFFVASWGDVVEDAERAREAETGERRCSSCGEWTAADASPCGSCGRDPATGEPWPETLRHVRLETGHSLRTWDTGRIMGSGMMRRTRIGFELRDPAGEVVFRGEDFGASPLHGNDSDEALRALLGFLTLRPGDTDRDYFDGYSAEQLEFAGSSDCELLAWLYSEDGPGAFEDFDAGEVAR